MQLNIGAKTVIIIINTQFTCNIYYNTNMTQLMGVYDYHVTTTDQTQSNLTLA